MKAVIWSKVNCSYCDRAKELLNNKNIPYEERQINNGWTKEQLLETVPTARTVPQIFLDGVYVGGYDQLKEHFQRGVL